MTITATSSAESGDYDLIRACREGKDDAWAQVIDRYERLVYSIPLQYGLSREEAADVAQATFVILLQRLESLRDDSHLAAWLSTVARRQTWRMLKRTKSEISLDHDEMDWTKVTIVLGMTDTEHVNKFELTTWINHGLAQLDKRSRELIVALYFDDEQPSYNEIAARLGMSVGSIGPTRARCLERLRRVLLSD